MKSLRFTSKSALLIMIGTVKMTKRVLLLMNEEQESDIPPNLLLNLRLPQVQNRLLLNQIQIRTTVMMMRETERAKRKEEGKRTVMTMKIHPIENEEKIKEEKRTKTRKEEEIATEEIKKGIETNQIETMIEIGTEIVIETETGTEIEETEIEETEIGETEIEIEIEETEEIEIREIETGPEKKI